MPASCGRADGSESRVSVATGNCRATLGLDGRGRPSPHETCLEQRGWSPLPAFAFLFRNVFDVVDVSAGLGQDVMQVVADADEGKTLLEELADARCPEQEDAEDGVVLAR